MARFVDAMGRDWSVEINVPAMRRVKELTGKHLGKLLENECALFSEITSDPILFADVLRAICSPQITERNLTAEQFEESLAGDAAERAAEAFWGAVVDFSPSRIRQPLRDLATKGEQLRTEAAKRLTELIPQLPTDLVDLLAATSSPTASGSPASSESTPAN